MSAFTPANSIGWAAGDPVTSAQMNQLDQDHVKTINIVDGLATYNPAGLVQIGGAGFRWNGPTLFSSTSATDVEGAFDVQSATGRLYVKTSGKIVVQTTGEIVVETGGAIAVQTGGDLNIQTGGAMTWEDGALITAEDGSTFNLEDGSVMSLAGIMNFGATSEIHGDPTLMSGAELTALSGSTITAASGSTVSFSGTTTFANSTWPALSPARTWSRRNLRLVGSEVPAQAEEMFGVPMLSAATTTFLKITPQASAFLTLLELDDLPDGQTITSVVIRSVGANGAPIITREATYRVVRWTNEAAAATAMSAATDDAHVSGDWSTTALDTTITITSNSTIDRSYRYGVEILCHDVSTTDPLHVISVLATGTAASIRV